MRNIRWFGMFTMILCGSGLYAQKSTTHFGLMLREDFQMAAVDGSTDQQGQTQLQSQPGTGIGVFGGSRGDFWGWQGSVILTGSKYEPNYTSGANTFRKADLKQVQLNLHGEYHPGGGAFFLEAGPQLLIRRYGTEYYTGGSISDTYWPKTRLMVNAGLGADVLLNGVTYCRISAGIRANPEKGKVVYDVPVNQVWIALAVGLFSAEGNGKRVKCYQF